MGQTTISLHFEIVERGQACIVLFCNVPSSKIKQYKPDSFLAICDDPYDYALNPETDLISYNIEQQAQIISDYFALIHLRDTPGVSLLLSSNSEIKKCKKDHSRFTGLSYQHGTTKLFKIINTSLWSTLPY